MSEGDATARARSPCAGPARRRERQREPGARPRIAYLSYNSTAEYDARTFRMAQSAIEAAGRSPSTRGGIAGSPPSSSGTGIGSSGHRTSGAISCRVCAASRAGDIGPRWPGRRRRCAGGGPRASPAIAGATDPAILPLPAARTLALVAARSASSPCSRWAGRSPSTMSPNRPTSGTGCGRAPCRRSIGCAGRHGGRTIYDSRDVFMHSRKFARLGRPGRYLLEWAERRWARAADRVLTVNEPYAAPARRAAPRPAAADRHEHAARRGRRRLRRRTSSARPSACPPRRRSCSTRAS